LLFNSARAAVPDVFAGLQNTYVDDPAAVEASMMIYQERCVRCHGENALGLGSAADSLDPPPSNLVFAVDSKNDDYLFWRISEGTQGVPISSSMPSFSSVLNEQEIWQVIAYLEQLGD
jgi:mono/diheme cytochrome c family protein